MKKLKKLIVSAITIAVLGNAFLIPGIDPISKAVNIKDISVSASEREYKTYRNFVYYEHNLDTEKQARIVDYTGTAQTLTVPATINGRKVYIDYNAFAHNETLKKVVVSEGITHILSGAFAYCTNLEEINVPSTLQIVWDDSFTGSNKLKFTGPGVPEVVETMASLWVIKKNIFNIKNDNAELKKYQRVNKITQELRRDLTYNSSTPNPGDPASVLNTLQATCGGYSRAFYHICLEAGIPESDIKVVGDCHCHAWNYIKISGKWYNMDLTNNVYYYTDSQYSNLMVSNWGNVNSHYYSKWYNVGELYDGFAADQKTTLLSNLGISANTYKGDLNGDGVVNVFDLTILKRFIVDNQTSAIIPSADYNKDGVIDVSDASALQDFLLNRQ